MRHAMHWHLMGSAGLALLIGLLTSRSPEQMLVLFVLMVIGWGCIVNGRDAWHRWQTQRSPILALGLAWNLGLAVVVWELFRAEWGFGGSLLVLLGYSVIPWGMGRLSLWEWKRWRGKANDG